MALQPTKKIWFDGAFIPLGGRQGARPHSRVTLRLRHIRRDQGELDPKGTAIFRLREHIKRLMNGTKVYRMMLPFTEEQLVQGCLDLVKVNGLNDCYIRPIVYSSYGEMGVNPMKNKISGAIAAWGRGSYLGDEGIEKGIRATISSWSRIDLGRSRRTPKCSANYAELDTRQDGRALRRLRRGDIADHRRAGG